MKNEFDDMESDGGVDDGILCQLVDAFCEVYDIDGAAGSMELMSTLDIVEEMGQIAAVKNYELVKLLDERGFRMKYTEAGFYWRLYKRG